jgi:hypothetical protein
MAQDWLRKAGTNEVFVRTAILADRNDMMPVTEDDAMRIRGMAAKKPQAVSAPVVKAIGIDFDAMDEDELRVKASEMKIAIPDGVAVDKIRKRLKKVAEKDAESAAMADGKVPTAPAPKTEADVAIPVVDQK